MLHPLPTAVFNADHLSTVASLQETQLLLEFRMILEVGLASLAAQKVTASDLAAMQKSITAYEQATDENAIRQADVAFHKAIANATKNPIAVMVLETISGPLDEQMRTLNKYPIPLKGALDDHIEIYRAIEQKDARKARAAMRKHLETVERNIRISTVAAESEIDSSTRPEEDVHRSENTMGGHVNT